MGYDCSVFSFISEIPSIIPVTTSFSCVAFFSVITGLPLASSILSIACSGSIVSSSDNLCLSLFQYFPAFWKS